jgi:hypothetical protein
VAHAVDLANVNGAVLWVNAAYEQLTGFEFDEAHGRQLDFLEHSDAPQMAVAITRVRPPLSPSLSLSFFLSPSLSLSVSLSLPLSLSLSLSLLGVAGRGDTWGRPPRW